MTNEIHDVVVVGAGPGGSSAAHYLAHQGVDVVLLDKAEFPRDKTCGDGLTPRALWVLNDMEVLDQVNTFANRINGMELHGATGDIMVAPIPENERYPNHLLIAPRYQLDEILLQRAMESGAQYQGNTQVRGVQHFSNYAEVLGNYRGKEVRFAGRVIILAVGANLSLLKKLGLLNPSPALVLAVRGYFEGVQGLTDRVQVHFNEVPLPGYGWVFPLSETRANVGLGVWGSWAPWIRRPSSTYAAFDHFLTHNPKMEHLMANAKVVGSVKGFPLRVDFVRSKTCDGRILLVGESAGLVSPFTGEGIDFALESGRLAAKFIHKKLLSGDFSNASLAEYDRFLRSHFQRLFVFLTRIRQLYINSLVVNKAIRATNKFPDLKILLAKIILSEADAASLMRFSVIRKVIMG